MTAKNKDIDTWLDRVNTLMDEQKKYNFNEVKMTVNRADLITLAILLEDLQKGQ